MNPRYRVSQTRDLGTFLRAARHMFFYSDVHDAYLRIRWLDEERGLAQVETCPPREIPEITLNERKKSQRRVEYIAWGTFCESEKREFLSLFPFLREQCRQYKVWTLDVNADRDAMIIEPVVSID